MKDNRTDMSLEIVQAIIEELKIYHGDEDSNKMFRYNERDLRDIIHNIEVLTKNYRCQCGKLIDEGDIDNYECSNCGFHLPYPLEQSIKPLIQEIQEQ